MRADVGGLKRQVGLGHERSFLRLRGSLEPAAPSVARDGPTDAGPGGFELSGVCAATEMSNPDVTSFIFGTFVPIFLSKQMNRSFPFLQDAVLQVYRSLLSDLARRGMSSPSRIVAFCLGFAGATAASAADFPTPSRPQPSGIRVLSAQYGDPGSGQLCNAAAPIAAICDGRRECSFDVRNTALCGDPSFLIVKQLAVTYTCGVGEYRTRVSEYDRSILACR